MDRSAHRHRGVSIVLCLVVLAVVWASPTSADEMSQEVVDMVIDALKSDDAQMRTGAIALVRDIAGEEVTKALAKELPKLPAEGQVQLLSAFADRGDPAALPAVLGCVKSDAESVRIAALKAISQLGDASTVTLLAETAARTRGAEQKAAQESLYRLRGEAIDQAVLQRLGAAEPLVKVQLVRAIGQRNITAGIDSLLETATDPDRRVRIESLKVLKIVAGPDTMPALVDLLLNLRSASDRNEAERTVAAVAHKIEDENRQASAVLAVLPSVKDVDKRASVLRVLGRIGDNSALPALRAAIKSKEAELQDAAIRALSEWPTAEPVPDLLRVAQTTTDNTHKVLALRGFVKLLALPSNRAAAEVVQMYTKAMSLAPNAVEKKRVLSGLGNIKSVEALAMAEGYLSDIGLHLEAELATVKIAESIYGSYREQCAEALGKVIKATHNDTIRKQAEEVLRQIERFDDYITAWQVSGPYTQANLDGGGLFDVAFEPEKDDGKSATWTLMRVGTDGNRPWLVEFDKVLGGDNRAAYLRCQVHSDKQQKAKLEIGSDDGVKVWLNGQVVHSNNATRPVSPGQDKADVTLKQGWNDLLVKVTQSGGEWAVCARLRTPDGSKLEGLKVRVP